MALRNSFMILFLTIVLWGLAPLSSQAYTYYIDEFYVVKNGTEIFRDSFDDGVPPPSAPNYVNGDPAQYFMGGTMGPESGGQLTLDSSGAIFYPNPGGDPFLIQRARLNTNIDQTDLDRGLKIDDTFSVTGVFDLIPSSVQRETYGVRFDDAAPDNTVNDLILLTVGRSATDNLFISFRELDYEAGEVRYIDSALLDTNHDQIALTLMRETLDSNTITAYWTYIDSGVWGTTFQFTNTVDIFDGENFTRPGFSAHTPVPLPGAVWLFGSGLAGLFGLRRRVANSSQ